MTKTAITQSYDLPAIERLKKDVRDAAKLMSAQEARYLVDSYYQMQDNRIRSANQVRAMSTPLPDSETPPEPNLVLSWLLTQSESLETSIKNALLSYVKAHEVGNWLLSIYGIGPVIAAGLLAHIDITKANTAAKIWRYAGLDPTSTWNKGEKRPWNAELKTLCWKAGQSFMKFHKQEECFYGRMYADKKAELIKQNESGLFKEYALEKKDKVGKSTEAYKAYSAGLLPPGQIDARARRYCVKMFLAHLQQVWWETHFKTPCAVPYALAHLGHVDYIAPPNYVPLAR